MEKLTEFEKPEESDWIPKLTAFSEKFTYSSLLLSNDYTDKYGKYEFLAAYGAYRIFQAEGDPFIELKHFLDERRSWAFGHLNYELKDKIEDLHSSQPSKHLFPEIFFFEPAYLLLQKNGSKMVEVFVNDEVHTKPILDFVEELKRNNKNEITAYPFPKLTAEISQNEYLAAIEKLKEEIQYGNIYEVNYCQRFSTIDTDFNPYLAFNELNKRSPMPFAAFYKIKDAFAITASPERFLQKEKNKLISQPIKGTIKRGKNEAEDEQLKQELLSDIKEQTENVMIVDLVRNDLSRTAEKASVKVEELFGIYTFPQLHQLISTVSCILAPSNHYIDALKYTYPMGSMTGAPKISAMKIIEEYESSRRELYSGTIGYIDPYGNFDFNVVIRSLMYNAQSGFLSLTVGGAITNQSEAEKEYAECLLKAKAIFEL